MIIVLVDHVSVSDSCFKYLLVNVIQNVLLSLFVRRFFSFDLPIRFGEQMQQRNDFITLNDETISSLAIFFFFFQNKFDTNLSTNHKLVACDFVVVCQRRITFVCCYSSSLRADFRI